MGFCALVAPLDLFSLRYFFECDWQAIFLSCYFLKWGSFLISFECLLHFLSLNITSCGACSTEILECLAIMFNTCLAK